MEKDDIEKLAWLRLIRSENIGPATFWALLDRFGTAENTLEKLPHLAEKGGLGRRIRVCDVAGAQRELEQTYRAGADIVLAKDDAFPKLLSMIDPPPPLIVVRGSAQLMHKKSVAVVGSRNASATGRRFARTMAQQAGEAQFVVVSGLARGIDGAAHEGALQSGTIAVLAGGIDQIYPPEHARLYNDIAERGAIVSERPVGVAAQARDFPRRNRLISGLSLGVLLIEAAMRSGSLITARFALEQNREVFAVPGSPLDPRCAGTNSLIKQGAHLVETIDDVLFVLEQNTLISFQEHKEASTPHLKKEFDYGNFDDEQLDIEVAKYRDRVHSFLSPTPTPIDELIQECRLPTQIVHTTLLELELAGKLERHIGGRVSLI